MVDEGPASENLHSLRKSRDKYMFSGIRHIAAEREPCRHLRSAPRAAVTHAGLRRMTGCDPMWRIPENIYLSRDFLRLCDQRLLEITGGDALQVENRDQHF